MINIPDRNPRCNHRLGSYIYLREGYGSLFITNIKKRDEGVLSDIMKLNRVQ